ncbi:aromatic-ring-hydroxylating dioxygenase subunit beta [Ferrovibrio sp.]|uniref:aromatic-ring-hydroxylating dioxygenase subunit beta n=1 Tax=Ferrovibrio sp. TaxID=1917215 RepID=UPI0025C247ED|nr:aromatic-ring-hydroxylating dioxygenase subunit beta [Ferrovibrio sp.]
MSKLIRPQALPLSVLEAQYYVDQFNATYGDILDRGDYDAWVELFTEDCLYKVIPRENHDAGLPLATMALESRGMLKDRAYGITTTLFHAPYYQRHVIGVAQILNDNGSEIRATANYSVFRTKPGSVSEIYNVGRYLDLFLREGAGLKLKERVCVFDSEMILNSMIYPI